MRSGLPPSWGRLVAAMLAVAALGAGLVACSAGAGRASGVPRVIVLGFDGMDHELTARLMAAGRLPGFSRLAQMGGFRPLETAVPPQSPVAWSDFITGMDAGGHGIFDFVHRDPATMEPYLSTSRTVGAERSLTLGRWQFPLAGARIELLRQGRAFWEVLEERGVPCTIVRMPANFPPSGTATRELSGMGTPDLLGTPGTFSFYTSELFAFTGSDISGGRVYEVYPYENQVEAVLYGPDNPFLVERSKAEVPFKVYIDPVDPVVKLEIGAEELVLAVGEWSGWVPVDFELIPTQTLRATVRFHLKRAHPELELYVTPLQIDPMAPALPISTPGSYAADLAGAGGRFYTQGMPEDTKALTGGIFTMDEFLAQAEIAGREILDQYRLVLDDFGEGLLFYYFGNLDQKSHMLWRAMDPDHPAYDAERDAPYEQAVVEVYQRFDEIVGYTLEHMGEGTKLVVMSDHGFTSWRRAFHLNTWLVENGYLVLDDPGRRAGGGLFAHVDWSRSRAYGLGLNGLYLNLRGREASGIVEPEERGRLLEEISERLLAYVDPTSGGPAVTRVYRSETFYRDRGHLEIGPDLIVGYAKGVRGSNESALGEVGADVMSDNLEEWSGDHCMDHTAVPGILLTSAPLARPASSLRELSAAILAEFGASWPRAEEPRGAPAS